MMNKDEDKGEK